MVTSVTKANYIREVQSYRGLLLIVFHTTVDPRCHVITPLLDQIYSERGKQMKIVKIDTGIETELVSEFDIRNVPTYVLLDNGDRKARLTGAFRKKDIELWLDTN